MIRISCTDCDAVLEIDDAFAGGVCRCKHCGTIQTVPKELKRAATPMAAGVKGVKAAEEKPKALVHQATGAGALDELAHVVASSGLAGAHHVQREAHRAEARGNNRKRMVLMGVGAVVLVLLGAAVTYWVMRSGRATGGGQQNGAAEVVGKVAEPKKVGSGVAAVKGPSFMGVALKGPSVVYVLDRGQGTVETFDSMKAAVINSAASLGVERKFAVIFWETDTIIAWPGEGLRAATEQNVNECRGAVTDVYCLGQSKVGPALEKAIAQNPAEIVLATGKGGLDEQFVNAVMAARKSGSVKIHTFCLGNGGSVEAMKAVATKTGGEFRAIGTGELREFVE
ncbi:MAG: hypothetical protein NTU53_25425 [Planctomycetota bacterium]|nr:hypothetical protein [Planctomycetota bacterium]